MQCMPKLETVAIARTPSRTEGPHAAGPPCRGPAQRVSPNLYSPLLVPGLPATAFTDDVSLANVSTLAAIASEFVSSARIDVDVADQLVVLSQLGEQRIVVAVTTQVVAELVVARVQLRARDAAEDRGLGRCLRHLGAGEQATGREADSDERAVPRMSVGSPTSA